MRRLASLACFAALLVAAAPASAAPEPQASLPDLEDEVMCTICGTTLQLANSPQAERQRALINELIAEGRDKEEIKAALVDEYGSEVLAIPSTDGFDRAAWIVPIAGVLLGLGAIALAARRWRRDRQREANQPTGAAGAQDAAIDPGDAERLQADLARYDA